jgi:hypothetical protein
MWTMAIQKKKKTSNQIQFTADTQVLNNFLTSIFQTTNETMAKRTEPKPRII